MQSHFNTFIRIFIVHVVDDIKCVHVSLSQPFHHRFEAFHYFVVIKVFGSDSRILRTYLCAGFLIHTTVDCIQQSFCQVSTGSEELHLFTDTHCRYAASDTVVVSVDRTHQIVIFILNRTGFNGNLRTIFFEAFRQFFRPQYSQVWFWCWSQIVQGVQEAEAVLSNASCSVYGHTADGFCNPSWVAAEQFVIVRRTQEFNDTQFHDEMVNQFLCLFFSQYAFSNITFYIDIKEGRYTAERHCSTVLLFDSSEVSEVYPLESFFSVVCWFGNIHAMHLCHLFQFAKCTNLFGNFFTKTDNVICQGIHFKVVKILFLFFDQEVNTVKCYAAVVADNTATAISIRKTRDDTGFTNGSHFGCICIKYALVMRFADVREHFNDVLRKFEAVCFGSIDHHLDSAERLNGTFERSICLNTDNLFFILVDVTRLVGYNCRYSVNIYIKYAAVGNFLLGQFRNNLPKFCCVVCRTCKEIFLAYIRIDVLFDKIIYIDFLGPFTFCKTSPTGLYFLYIFFNHRHAKSLHLYLLYL
ncbi:hypothetical protein D3C75_672500 [compost metagenome]